MAPSGATRGQALAELTRCLAAAGIETAPEDARSLLRAACSLSRLDLALAPDVLLSAAERARLSAFADRRLHREPVSRIVGARGFWTVELAVAPDVLDPRADTETLIETTLALLSGRRETALSILDLGAGSGAISCALLDELPRAHVVAVDLSPTACRAAAANIARCGFADRAAVLCGNWGDALGRRFDVIVSNPPYIRSADIDGLDPDVRLYDPPLALDGGADGFDAYRAIVADLPRLCVPDGIVAFEAGAGQADGIAALLAARGFVIAQVARDLAGRPRAVAARAPAIA
jgi:release factor glutamine methyltransferase